MIAVLDPDLAGPAAGPAPAAGHSAFALGTQLGAAAELDDPRASEVTTTLAVSAGAAYEIFADAIEIPRWLPIVQTARTVARHADGRPSRVAFTRRLERGSLGYTLEYRYDPANLTVTWRTPETSNVVLCGEARFTPLSMRACLMRYQLVIDLPVTDDLVAYELARHPASQVASEFREHVRRLC